MTFYELRADNGEGEPYYCLGFFERIEDIKFLIGKNDGEDGGVISETDDWQEVLLIVEHTLGEFSSDGVIGSVIIKIERERKYFESIDENVWVTTYVDIKETP